MQQRTFFKSGVVGLASGGRVPRGQTSRPWPFRAATESLRLRLTIIPSVLLLLGLVSVVAVQPYNAADRLNAEISSSSNIAERIVEDILGSSANETDPQNILNRLRRSLMHVRHITVLYRPLKGADLPLGKDEGKRAPAWFLNLFEPAKLIKTYPVLFQGTKQGELLLWTRPNDEIYELWSDVQFLAILLTAISCGIIVLIQFFTSRMLRPLHDLVQGLNHLRCGQFDDIGEIHVRELHEIGEQFNALSQSLAKTQADNRLLVDRLMTIQESERKELARELHDEFGACLFGIRAAASCIASTAASQVPTDANSEIVEHARSISMLTDSVQKHNYRILDRIRPTVLQQMGLAHAIHHLVESWNVTNKAVRCELLVAELPNKLGEEESLTIYRIVQEALTNVGRHAKASTVRIMMDYRGGTEIAGEKAVRGTIDLLIEDDGIGLPRDVKFGYGFLGMSERVRKFGGRLKVDNGIRGGTLIQAVFPLGNPRPESGEGQ